MEAVKFTLSGRNAFFKKPEVNAYYYRLFLYKTNAKMFRINYK